MPNVVVDAKDVDEFDADDRGRICLGAEYANKTVEIAVIEADDDDGD